MQKKHIYFAVGVLLIAALWTAFSFWDKINRQFEGDYPAWIYIPRGSSELEIEDSLKSSLGSGYGKTVNEIWKTIGGRPEVASGAYRVTPGMKVLDIARALKNGSQTPVRVTFNNIRTFSDFISRISEQLEFSNIEFKEACDTILPQHGFNDSNFIGAFIPDTYELYWLTSPSKTVIRLLNYYDRFWNDERKTKAKALNLSPQQVTTLASIVEEETNSTEERPIVARLYLNRLQKGMKLQADPTVKYAVGDFSLRRILNKHLQIESPYNTYIVNGLPPGPIRMPESATIDAVLNAPQNSYLYMCAREDFSGHHNFANTLEQHNANAARYRAALNARGIR